MTELHIAETARMVVEEQGSWAIGYALEGAKDALLDGDEAARKEWMRIIEIIQDIAA